MADRSARSVMAPLVAALLAGSLAACTTTSAASPPSAVPTVTTPTRTTVEVTSSPASTSTAGPSTTSDEQLAIEAVQRYYAAFNEALVTLKTTEMRKLFQPGCLVCERDVAAIDKMARDGDRITGGATLLSGFVPTLRSGDLQGLRATAHSEAMIIHNRAGTVTTNEAAVTGTKHFTVLRRDDTWILEGIT